MYLIQVLLPIENHPMEVYSINRFINKIIRKNLEDNKPEIHRQDHLVLILVQYHLIEIHLNVFDHYL
jgi:hypothetical protein